jgi:hypothetical protein
MASFSISARRRPMKPIMCAESFRAPSQCGELGIIAPRPVLMGSRFVASRRPGTTEHIIRIQIDELNSARYRFTCGLRNGHERATCIPGRIVQQVGGTEQIPAVFESNSNYRLIPETRA